MTASPQSPPVVLAYDLEIARPLPERNGRPQWHRAPECGIATLCVWVNSEEEPRIYTPGLPDWHDYEMDRFLSETYKLAEERRLHLLSWNGIGFDDDVIGHARPWWYDFARDNKKVDLCVIAGLFGIAPKKGVDETKLSAALANGVPDDYPTLVTYSAKAKLAVRSGWSLEKTYRATFKATGVVKSIEGAQAPILWQEGRYPQVIGYCVGDAYKLLRLWQYAWDGGVLVNAKGRSAKIPREAL